MSLPEPNNGSEAPSQRPLRYRIDRWIRTLVMRVISALASGRTSAIIDPRGENLQRILLVRANFRIGNVILTLPALATFRKNYPNARIDYLGSALSRSLFLHQAIDHHYETPRRFPQVLWQYFILLRRLRANRYDLALDVSCSQSGLASFLIGLSGARIRAGCAGKWDGLFNYRIDKLSQANKYDKLGELLAALGLHSIDAVGRLEFSVAELSAGEAALAEVVGKIVRPIVGIFLGGRKLRGKRWPLESFAQVIAGLSQKGFRVVTFLGPEEADIAAEIKTVLGPGALLVSEPSLRKFAAMVTQLDLFICCDSGPMHLACALGVRVLAIFRERDLLRWAPPPSAARTVSSDETVSGAAVLTAALEELSYSPANAGQATSA